MIIRTVVGILEITVEITIGEGVCLLVLVILGQILGNHLTKTHGNADHQNLNILDRGLLGFRNARQSLRIRRPYLFVQSEPFH